MLILMIEEEIMSLNLEIYVLGVLLEKEVVKLLTFVLLNEDGFK